MEKENIVFDVEKLKEKEREIYNSLAPEDRPAYEKKWIAVERNLKKLRQAKANLAKANAKQNEAKRKARTHRLIEVGSLVESALGRELDETQRKALLSVLKENRERKDGTTYTSAGWLCSQIDKVLAAESTPTPAKNPEVFTDDRFSTNEE